MRIDAPRECMAIPSVTPQALLDARFHGHDAYLTAGGKHCHSGARTSRQLVVCPAGIRGLSDVSREVVQKLDPH